MQKIIIILSLLLNSFIVTAQNGIYAELTPLQSDSLVKANKTNPNFVILDVRTPAEYKPKHLEGAINRNYYETFDNKLDSLDKNKRYLLHCQSGARSAGAFAKMKTKNFREVYNMKGGISAWSNANLTTTSLFAPKLMLVSDTIYDPMPIFIGSTDTVRVTITNRANDTLTFDTISLFSTSEFSTDFDLDTTLLGAADYSFNIYYSPVDAGGNILIFTIKSNGGIQFLKVLRYGVFPASTFEKAFDELIVYPNPASDDLYIQNISEKNARYLITDINGILAKRIEANENNFIQTVDISDLKPGMYLVVRISSDGKAIVRKFIKG